MTTAPVIDLRRYGQNDPSGTRQTLLDVHASAYFERRHEKFVQRFRPIYLFANSANHRSTRFSQDDPVGVSAGGSEGERPARP